MLDVGGKDPQPVVTHAIFRIVEGDLKGCGSDPGHRPTMTVQV